jgi:uncharacterized protein YqjF (DUF2071 family)
MSALDFLRTPARQAAALDETAHRPWPVPSGPWTLAQSWEDLLFAHWRVEAEQVRKLVPPALELEEHEGSAWLGITPFVLTGFRLRGTLPLPRVSTFPELNVRTYVTAGGKPGIWFFSLDAASLVAVEAARRAYKLPYFQARMEAARRGGAIAYSSARREAARPFCFEATYGGEGDPAVPAPGSLEHFLTERYCLYAQDETGLRRAEIHHGPWRIRPAAVSLELNTMPPEGIDVQGEPLYHLAERQDVLIWPLEEA